MNFIKYALFFCIVLNYSFCQAQMIDTLSGLAIQGQLSAQPVKQFGSALSMLKQNEILNKLNIIILEASTIPNRSHLTKNSFNYNLSPLDWNIGPETQGKFFISLNNIDKISCTKFVSSLNYRLVYINNKKSSVCENKNFIKFIFD